MPVYAPLLNRVERVFSNSKFIVRLCVLLRNRLVRIIAYSLVKDHTVEKTGELLLIRKTKHLLKSVIDVGANKGEWTEMILAECSNNLNKLLLAEPGKAAFSILRHKFGEDKRITLLNVGLSDCEGMFFFNEEENASETSSFSNSVPIGSAQAYTQVLKLDSVVKEYNFGFVDFLKIDCEGFDFKVMNGAIEQIRSQQIGLIQFEYNSMWIHAGSTLKAAFDLLLSCNYDVYLLNNRGLVRYNVDYYKEFFGYSNFVAVSPAWRESIKDMICDMK